MASGVFPGKPHLMQALGFCSCANYADVSSSLYFLCTLLNVFRVNVRIFKQRVLGRAEKCQRENKSLILEFHQKKNSSNGNINLNIA